MKRFLLIFCLAGFITFGVQAQDFHMPQASPEVTINQSFSTSFIKLDYSRPGVKDRKIFGDLIPYGKLWRTGANSVSTVTFGEDVSLDGHKIKAGKYAIYSVPGQKIWQIIINEGVDNWGTQGFNSKNTVLKFTVPVRVLDHNQESFSINLENLRDDSADLVLAWEKTSIVIPIKADNNDKIVAHLNKELEGEKPPYFKAASYYLSTNQNMDEALELVNKAIKQNSDAYYMH